MHYSIQKISKKREIQYTTLNHSSHINYNGLQKFLENVQLTHIMSAKDVILLPENPLHLQNNLAEQL